VAGELGLSQVLLGDNGVEMTRKVDYRVPTGATPGPLYFTVADGAATNVAGPAASGVAFFTRMANAYRAEAGSRRSHCTAGSDTPSQRCPRCHQAVPSQASVNDVAADAQRQAADARILALGEDARQARGDAAGHAAAAGHVPRRPH